MPKASPRKRKLHNVAWSRCGMVSTASSIATDAGVSILEKGGNAIDAAVAAAFCLGVTEPQASGLGGQSMILLRQAGGDNTVVAVDGSSRAPFMINPSRIPADPVKFGMIATTVPSTPAVLGTLLEKYGSMTLGEVLQPAIIAAAKGFKLTALQHRLLVREKERLREDEQIRKVFFKGYHPLNSGDLVLQPQLAACLKKIGAAGWRDFYHGAIAASIEQEMRDRGGWITSKDLQQIPLPVERKALHASYRGLELFTFPPPGAGRALVQILNTVEKFTPRDLTPGSLPAAIILSLAFGTALRERERRPIDPELFLAIPEEEMLDKKQARRIAERIREIAAYRGFEFTPPASAGETTHLSVADDAGNLVGITQSVELVFGSKVMARDLGFFYNSYMSSFDYRDILHPYYLLPGAKPWSSVAPTLIFEEGKPRLLLGSPGSERISTTLAQVISAFFDAKMSLDEAVEVPRLHTGSSGRISMEKERFDPAVVEALENAGFAITRRGAYSFYLGCVQAVLLPKSEGELFCGVSDPRRDGSAAGPQTIRGRQIEDSDCL